MSEKLPMPFTGTKGAKAPDVPLGKVTIYNVETGEAAVTKPINAREAVEGGHWSFTPVEPPANTGKAARKGKAADESADEARAARAKELKGLSADEVREIAVGAGVEQSTKAENIEAILAAEFDQ